MKLALGMQYTYMVAYQCLHTVSYPCNASHMVFTSPMFLTHYQGTSPGTVGGASMSPVDKMWAIFNVWTVFLCVLFCVCTHTCVFVCMNVHDQTAASTHASTYNTQALGTIAFAYSFSFLTIEITVCIMVLLVYGIVLQRMPPVDLNYPLNSPLIFPSQFPSHSHCNTHNLEG